MSFQSMDPYKKYGTMQGNVGEEMLASTKAFENSLDGSIGGRVEKFLSNFLGGDLAGVPLVGDPRSIRYSPPNAILKTPHLDSPYMDPLIERRFQPLTPPGPKGPQLPGFV